MVTNVSLGTPNQALKSNPILPPPYIYTMCDLMCVSIDLSFISPLLSVLLLLLLLVLNEYSY